MSEREYAEVWVSFSRRYDGEIDMRTYTDPKYVQRETRAYLMRVPVPSGALGPRDPKDGDVEASFTGETIEPCGEPA